MVEAGILTSADRVELIDGAIIPMTPIAPKHAACVRLLTRLLIQQCGEEVLVNPPNPLQLEPYMEVYPDVTLLKPRADQYRSANPSPTDVLLLN